MRTATVAGNQINLEGARIEAAIHLNYTQIPNGRIWARSLRAGSDLWLSDAVIKRADFSGATIEGSMFLWLTNLTVLDLSGATIGRYLSLINDYGKYPPKWTAGSRISLRNTKIGILMDDASSWPEDLPGFKRNSGIVQHRDLDIGGSNAAFANLFTMPAEGETESRIDLQGFAYDRLGTYADGDPASSTVIEGSHKGTDWYQRWLGSDRTFSRQPYQQLASVLRGAGDTQQADAVMYAAREREREQKWEEHDYPKAMLLSALRCFIGYGIGYRSFWALYWVGLITATGFIVLQFSKAAREKGLIWCLGASLDQLLPIIELNKEFGDFFNDPDRVRFKGWQLAYFAVQAIIGYALASFVVAGMAGLTQAQ
jgi:hypothetical protein